jgi:hypothetical protein
LRCYSCVILLYGKGVESLDIVIACLFQLIKTQHVLLRKGKIAEWHGIHWDTLKPLGLLCIWLVQWDLASLFASSKFGRFVYNLRIIIGNDLERVLRYLNGTMSYVIHYTEYTGALEGYCDAKWISDADEIYNNSWYAFSLEVGTIP